MPAAFLVMPTSLEQAKSRVQQTTVLSRAGRKDLNDVDTEGAPRIASQQWPHQGPCEAFSDWLSLPKLPALHLEDENPLLCRVAFEEGIK